MRKALVCLVLAFACLSLSAQTELYAGLRLFQSVGLEAGLTFGNRFGFKGISQCDWYRLSSPKRAQNEIIGKTYRLMYGGGLMMRVAGDFWLSVNAGYGWRGKYLFEETSGTLAVTDEVKGLDLGADIRWHFHTNWSAMIGYETIPVGFKIKRPVHEIVLGICFHIPF